MVPARVKFIGNEDDYIQSCDEIEGRFCSNACKKYSVCSTKKTNPRYFTFGTEYKACVVEYWEGTRNGLYVTTNLSDSFEGFIPFEDFETISDPDNLLNDYEAEVRCIYPGYDGIEFDLKTGSVYKAIGRDRSGYYLIMDESFCCYYYPSEEFEIVSDPHGILSKESLYFGYLEDNDEPDYIAAHSFCSNHKPELSQDSICGCFGCLKIFEPKEIEEWIFADNRADKRGTAVCPYCGIDSVIGASSGFPITQVFLNKMNSYWFSTSKDKL